MALNPPINAEGQPMRVEGEYFAILRKNMEIEVKIEGLSKISAKGKLFVTTARLVFVNEKHSSGSFKSFDMPLANLCDEKFEQPIFGANYLYLRVKPLFGLIPGDAKVKLWFMSGGCQKFLDIFLQILPQVRKRKAQGADPNFIQNITNGNLSNQFAYVDPSDPTYIFVEQPAYAQQNPQMNDYYSKFPEAQPGVDYAPPQSGTQTQYNQGGYNQYPQQQQQQQQQQHYQQPQSTVPNYGSNQQSFGGQGIVIGTGVPSQDYSNTQFQVHSQQPISTLPPQENPGYTFGPGQQMYSPQTQSYGQNQQQNQAGYGQYNNTQNQYQYQPQTQPQSQGQIPGVSFGYGGQQQQQQPQIQGTQQQQQQQQPQPQPQQNRPNVGYYYGFWGPQLQTRIN